MKIAAIASLCLAVLATPALAAEQVVLSVNASDAPASAPVWNFGQNSDEEVGWLYTVPVTGVTPAYTITDLGTKFGTTSSQTVTAEIFSGLPSSGGTLIASGNITNIVANQFAYATLGTPVVLTAGTTYFIAFQNVETIGRNVTTVTGATSLGNEYYDYSTPGNNSFTKINTSTSVSHPILSFADNIVPVPEPSTWALMLTSLAGLVVVRRFRGTRQS